MCEIFFAKLLPPEAANFVKEFENWTGDGDDDDDDICDENDLSFLNCCCSSTNKDRMMDTAPLERYFNVVSGPHKFILIF